MATDLKTASVLAFERKLDPSDALFFSGDWNARDDELSRISFREHASKGEIPGVTKASW